ncbi:MAG: GLPGLI family protein [Paludibacteraceae bacterium]
MLSLLFLSVSLYSQTIGLESADENDTNLFIADKKRVIDECVLNIQYRMFYVKDVKNPDKRKSYYMELQIGKQISKFSDYQRLKIDSLEEVYMEQKLDGIQAINKISPLGFGTSPLNIFKNYPAEKITVTDIVPLSENFKYTEPKIKPIWKIWQENRTICGYVCKKATTTYRGRHYTAWYTPKIPYSDGPWKFWGLPGLILKVSDDKNEYIFECATIKKPKKNEVIYIKDIDYYSTTRERFNRAVKDFYQNPGPMFESKGVTVDGKPITIKSLPYNPIELSE